MIFVCYIRRKVHILIFKAVSMKLVMQYMQTQLERTVNTGINTGFQWV